MRRTIPAALLAALTLPLAAAPPAAAAPGTFTVHACGTPEHATGPAAGWVPVDVVGKFSEASALGCSTAGTMTANNGASKFATSGYGFRSGEGAALVFEAPSGLVASRLLIDASASASSRNTDGDYGAMEMFPSVLAARSGRLDLCKAVPGLGCVGGPSNFGYISRDAVREYFDLDDAFLRLDVRCGSDSRCNALGSEPIGITVDRAEVDLTESPAAAPSVTRADGALASDAVLRGTEALSVDATDNAAGVYRAVVTVDGQEVAVPLDGTTATCGDARPAAGTAYEFASPTPCPTSGSFAFEVDTARFAEGPAELAVHVEDASGLRSRVLGPRPVRIDNGPSPDDPVAPGNGTGGGAGTGGGTGSSAGGAPGATNGANASERAQITLSGRRTRTLRYGQPLRTSAVLRDEDGRPISGARVTVLERTAVPRAGWVTAREPLVTDGDGRMRWTVPAGPGRTIRLAYKSDLGNAHFSSTSDLVLRVRSKTSFTTNRRAFRNGQTIRFAGRVLSRPVPRTGVLIDLQARVGSKWQTFRTARTRAGGRWRASYRLRATRGVQRYTLRARVRKDSGFPYTASVARAVRITVRG